MTAHQCTRNKDRKERHTAELMIKSPYHQNINKYSKKQHIASFLSPFGVCSGSQFMFTAN